jgi:cellulose biosynthesis protein BcsQ
MESKILTAKVICFSSAKGGSGKTIVSASFAKVLAALDKNVLLIDLDAATNGLSLFYLEELIQAKEKFFYANVAPLGIFEANEMNSPHSFCIDAKIDLIPAVYKMKQTDCIFDENILKLIITNLLKELSSKYSYIIFDTQSGTDTYTKIAVENSDLIVIVSEYDPVSAEGVERFKSLFSAILPTDSTWILFNKILPEFATSLGEFLGVARYLSPIPWDADVVRALVQRKLAIDTARGNDYTLAIMRMASILLGKGLANEINIWLKNKEVSLKEPLLTKLDEIEKEITSTEKAVIETRFQIKRFRNQTKIEYVIIITAVPTICSIIWYLYSGSIGESFGIFVGVMFLGLLLLATLILIVGEFLTPSEKKMKMLEGQKAILERKLKELIEHKKKISVITDSRIEDIWAGKQ